MRDIYIERYRPGMAEEWNEFAARSRNATFLFNRGYMDYHSDRFIDHSLMARVGGADGKLTALLPACEVEDKGRRELCSHAGLTYGGWMLGERHSDASDMLAIFAAMKEYALAEEFDEIDYKPLPSIYSAMPSDEDLYALFRMGGVLKECNISCAINMQANPGMNTQQRRNLKRGVEMASAGGVHLEETRDIEGFHALLAACLAERHGALPVHTAAELRLLAERFPKNIRFFAAIDKDEEMLAGVCVFDTGRVAHAQYICSTPEGRERGVLTLLFAHLIDTVFENSEYFDFGISNERHGLYLNEGLYRQKSSLGGSGVTYLRYTLPLHC